jgi:hypothetical protein
MEAIHGAKIKDDKIDSKKIAILLRTGIIPCLCLSSGDEINQGFA